MMRVVVIMNHPQNDKEIIMSVKRDPTRLYCDEPTLTQQHFKEESDINVIVDRAVRAGGLAPAVSAGMFGDFTKIPSYRDAFDMVIKAQNLFMSLPWQVRERFGNNPQRLLEFLQNPQNRDEAVRLGLVEPLKVPVVTPAPSSPPAGGPGKGAAQ